MDLLILGTPRSGTTLLTCMVGAHPNCIMMSECFSAEEDKIVSPAEVIGNKLCVPNQIQFRHPPPRVSWRRLPYRVLNALGTFMPGDALNALPLGRISIQQYVRERGAHLLFIVRAPGQVIGSMVRRDGHDVSRAISIWAAGIREMYRAFDTFEGRAHVVSFASLVGSPEKAMRRVSAALDLPYAPSMLEGFEQTPQYNREKIDAEAARGGDGAYRIEERKPEAVQKYQALCRQAH